MSLHLNSVTFDAGDPVALAGFWALVFGAEATSPNPYVAFVKPPAGPNLMFIQVPEGKSAKNRCHLDLHTDHEREVDGEVARLVAAGASVVHTRREFGVYWTTLHDPEGNEFCVGAELADDT